MIVVTFDVDRATCISDIPSSRILRGVSDSRGCLKCRLEDHDVSTAYCQHLLPSRCRLLIREDCGYFCGDVLFCFVFVFVFEINGENISCAKKFLEAKMKCKVNALRENNHSRY